MAIVYRRNNERLDDLLMRFKEAVIKEKIFSNFKKHEQFTSAAQERKDKKLKQIKMRKNNK